MCYKSCIYTSTANVSCFQFGTESTVCYQLRVDKSIINRSPIKWGSFLMGANTSWSYNWGAPATLPLNVTPNSHKSQAQETSGTLGTYIKSYMKLSTLNSVNCNLYPFVDQQVVRVIQDKIPPRPQVRMFHYECVTCFPDKDFPLPSSV